MRILIFSDTHLTDKFEEKKFNLLKKIISQADKVIINGDFWDGYRTTFDLFISSDWKKLFPLLKSKKTVYLFGNHDRKTFANGEARMFSDTQTHNYELQIKEKKFLIEHGNRFYPLFDERLPRKVNFISTKVVGYILRNISVLHFVHRWMNIVMKRKIKKELRNNGIFLCGHSHYAEIDIENNFINTGSIQHGKAQYLLIEDGKLIPKEEWYE